MAHYQKPYILIKRTLKSGKTVYYYRLAGETVHHSTGKERKWQAHEYVENNILPQIRHTDMLLKDYLDPYFIWDKCPHVQRLLEEGKSISPSYEENQRARLTKYILTDSISDLPFVTIKRADILDFRSRLLKLVGTRTVNRTIGILKIVFKEAFFREEIDRDPTMGIGDVKYAQRERGIFTAGEMRALFAECPGVWRDLRGYAVFSLAAFAGMRRGEILELTWQQIDFTNLGIMVDKARTDNLLPKHDKIRQTPITERCAEALRQVRAESNWVLPQHLVFCYADGSHIGFTWWDQRFRKAMASAGFDRAGRGLVPHSLRHTLATVLSEADYNPKKIRATMGWSGEKVQDGYTHYDVMDHSRQREIIERELI